MLFRTNDLVRAIFERLLGWPKQLLRLASTHCTLIQESPPYLGITCKLLLSYYIAAKHLKEHVLYFTYAMIHTGLNSRYLFKWDVQKWKTEVFINNYLMLIFCHSVWRVAPSHQSWSRFTISNQVLQQHIIS